MVILVMGLGVIGAIAPARGAGLLADKENKVVIAGTFAQQEPALMLIFSAQPPVDAKGQLVTSMSEAEIRGLKKTNEQVAMRVQRKVAAGGELEFAFGTADDGSMPWNDGREFDWKDWEKYSPDIWDNLSVLAAPGERGQMLVNDVTIHRGGKVLFDSRARASYPNKRPVDAALKALDLAPRQGNHPVVNLGKRMQQFRREYYELGDNPILNLAYCDLAQTDKRKYANRGNNWCTEFTCYIYRQNGIMTPDPNRGDVHWKNMRAFFEQSGQVYPAREVAKWPDEKKRGTIKPGSFVSILIGDSTHSIIFTTWVSERGRMTRWVGVSGNNKAMVWPHAPMKLPSAEDLAGKSPQELAEFDQKVYFAVPGKGR
jgi:hypothetical protein